MITRHSRVETGLQVEFNEGQPVIRKVNKPMQGTMVSVRNIHKGSKSVQGTYHKYKENHYENAVFMLNEYSLILKDIKLQLTNEFYHKKEEQSKK